MKALTNAWLEKYQKEPIGYSYVEREYSHFKCVNYSCRRYFLNEDSNWQLRRKSRVSDIDEAKIMFTGAICCGRHQLTEAFCDDGYKFGFEFEKVKSIFAQSDLTVGDFETAVFPNAPYSKKSMKGYANAPYEFLKAVRKAGVDALTTSNKRFLSVGTVGVGETLDNIDRFGLIHTGAFNTDGKKRYEVIVVNGIKIALVSFFAKKTSNCGITDEGFEYMLNKYSRAKAKDIIYNAKADEADIIIACVSWNNYNQEQIASELAGLGYDCVIGYGRHGVQPFEAIEANGKKVPVFYSLGNLVCGSIGDEKSRSVIACVDIKRVDDEFKISCSYVPTFNCGGYKDRRYVVLPLKEHCEISANAQRLKDIKNAIGNNIRIADDIGYSEYYED